MAESVVSRMSRANRSISVMRVPDLTGIDKRTN